MTPSKWRTSTWVFITAEVIFVLLFVFGITGNDPDDTTRAAIGGFSFLLFLLSGIAFAIFRSVRRAPDEEGDPLEALDRLAQLKERGAITPEEYESKKAALLAKVR